MPIRIAVIEDDHRFRSSLETLFEHTPDFTLVGSFGSARDALAAVEAAPSHRPVPGWDLVLMDLQLPGLHGIEATRRLTRVLPDAAVVVLTVFEEPKTVLEAICAGADGYLVKRTAPDDLLDELRAVMRGGSPLSAGVARTVLDLLRETRDVQPARDSTAGPTRLDLTEREQDVLRCLVRGMAYKRAARQLGISVETVRSHVKSIYSKLQVHSVAQAVGRAIREQLI